MNNYYDTPIKNFNIDILKFQEDKSFYILKYSNDFIKIANSLQYNIAYELMKSKTNIIVGFDKLETELLSIKEFLINLSSTNKNSSSPQNKNSPPQNNVHLIGILRFYFESLCYKMTYISDRILEFKNFCKNNIKSNFDEILFWFFIDLEDLETKAKLVMGNMLIIEYVFIVPIQIKIRQLVLNK